MKNLNRVRKNGSAECSAPQAKTNPQNTVTVIFYSPDDDKELFRVDFPESLFAVIRAGAKKLGVSLDKFFELAILHKIGKDGRTPAAQQGEVCILKDRKTGRVIHDPAEWITVHVSSQIRRHLRAYGRCNVRAANGDLSQIAGAALKVAMLHRRFLQETSCRFVRYAKAEGFDGSDGQEKLMKSLLAAR